MELRHLRYFCAVAEAKGLSHAAKRLHVSQSCISEQIRDLEQEIGVPLLGRKGRTVELTPHGQVFLKEAKEILTHAERAVEMARRSLRGETGDLSIGFMISPTAPFLPEIIREFRHDHPGVHLSLFEMGPVQQMEALTKGDIDIAFTRSLEMPYSASLRSECLYSDAIVAILPKSHPLAPGPVPVEALAGERFVLYDRESWPGLFDTIVSTCRRAGFSPQITNSALMQTVLTLVGAGEGIAMAPSSVRHYRPKGLAFCHLQPEPPRVNLVMAWRDGEIGTAQKSFIDLVRTNKSRIQRVMHSTA